LYLYSPIAMTPTQKASTPITFSTPSNLFPDTAPELGSAAPADDDPLAPADPVGGNNPNPEDEAVTPDTTVLLTVLVPTTSPPLAALTVCPSMVAAGPPTSSVVPSITYPVPAGPAV